MIQKADNGMLFCCLGMGSGGADCSELDRLSDDDWDELVHHSDRHGVASLLFHRFSMKNMGVCVPDVVMQELRRIYLSDLWENSERQCELSKLLRALWDGNIPVIVMKGAALSELLYEDIALRPMCDIDLLIKEDDIWNVDEILLEMGYKSNISSLLSPRHLTWVRHVNYRKGSVAFQIHVRIPELPKFDPWVNALPAEIASSDVYILGWEDFLLHLCLHLKKHFGTSGTTELIRWYDILKLLKHRGANLDWEYVINTTRDHGVEGTVYSILRAVDEYCDANVPPAVMAQFREMGMDVSITDELRTDCELREIESLFSSMSNIPSIHNKIYHVFRRIFPCRGFMIKHFSIAPSESIYPYYLVRIAELFVKSFKSMWHLLGYLKRKRALTGNK